MTMQKLTSKQERVLLAEIEDIQDVLNLMKDTINSNDGEIDALPDLVSELADHAEELKEEIQDTIYGCYK